MKADKGARIERSGEASVKLKGTCIPRKKTDGSIKKSLLSTLKINRTFSSSHLSTSARHLALASSRHRHRQRGGSGPEDAAGTEIAALEQGERALFLCEVFPFFSFRSPGRRKKSEAAACSEDLFRCVASLARAATTTTCWLENSFFFEISMPPFPLDSLSRRLLRQAVLRVHPDIFAGVNLEAASFNAESLVVREIRQTEGKKSGRRRFLVVLLSICSTLASSAVASFAFSAQLLQTYVKKLAYSIAPEE